MNLQLDHFSDTLEKLNHLCLAATTRLQHKKHTFAIAKVSCRFTPRRGRGARLPQRVAMDDLASHFVEERSKVR